MTTATVGVLLYVVVSGLRGLGEVERLILGSDILSRWVCAHTFICKYLRVEIFKLMSRLNLCDCLLM